MVVTLSVILTLQYFILKVPDTAWKNLAYQQFQCEAPPFALFSSPTNILIPDTRFLSSLPLQAHLIKTSSTVTGM